MSRALIFAKNKFVNLIVKIPSPKLHLAVSARYLGDDLSGLRGLKRRGFNPAIIFDIGASYGIWSNAVYKVFPQASYYLFEPLVDHLPVYRKYMDIVLSMRPNFHLHKIAVGHRNGTVKMYTEPQMFGSTSLDMSGIEMFTPLEVPMIRLDEAISELNLPVPQLLKIDIQGGELAVLEGFKQNLRQVEVLLLETWLIRGYGTQTPTLLELSNWLLDYGFHLADFTGCYRGPDGTLEAQDCIFINKNSRLYKNKVI
jgi:FkbM family methyltransferase